MAEHGRKSKMERSYEKYYSYDPNVWSLEFFDSKTGGYVVVDLRRITYSEKSKGERIKYNNEFDMAKVFAMGGHQIEMLDEDSREMKYDANIDGVPADMKRIKGTNNIMRAAS